MIINKQNISAMFKGFTVAFNKAFDGIKPDWQKVATKVTSKSASETYPWLGNTTQMREWLGKRQVQNLKTHDFAIKNKTWENTVGVPRESVEDDNYGVYSPLFSQLGEETARFPDTLIFSELLKNGTSGLCYDGQPFFDTDHEVAGASVSNYGGGSGTAWYLLDCSGAIKPLILQERRKFKLTKKDKDTDENVFTDNEFLYGTDGRCNAGYGLWQKAYCSQESLTTDNYAAARAAMMSFKGDNGKPLGVRPTLLVVPPSLEAAAKAILEAERLANGETNTYRNTAELLVTPYLA